MKQAEAREREIGVVGALRTARLDRGMSLTELAAQTNIRVEHLRTLEENPSAWPDQAYPRAFARSYAIAVGIDPSEVADAFSQSADAWPKQSAPRRAEPRRKRWPWATLAVAAVAAGIGVFALLDGGSSGINKEPAGEQDTKESASGDQRAVPERGAEPAAAPPPISDPPRGDALAPQPQESALRLSSPAGLTFCAIADGKPAIETGLDAGDSEILRGSSFDLVFPYGFDPVDLEASVDGDPIVIPDTQGAAAVRIDPEVAAAETIPMPTAGCVGTG